MQMADKSTKQPVSMMEEVLLRLDQHVIRTDFIILDMPEVKKYLLSLKDLSLVLHEQLFIKRKGKLFSEFMMNRLLGTSLRNPKKRANMFHLPRELIRPVF
jgi:hypothetical protein